MCTYCNLVTLSAKATSSLAALSRRNKYDNDIIEYWVDVRTSGQKGLMEKEGMKESNSTCGETSTLSMLSMAGNLEKDWDHVGPGPCEIEEPSTKAAVLN